MGTTNMLNSNPECKALSNYLYKGLLALSTGQGNIMIYICNPVFGVICDVCVTFINMYAHDLHTARDFGRTF